jgi:hypothetical protein
MVKDKKNKNDVKVLYLNGQKNLTLLEFIYLLDEFQVQIHQCMYFISDNYNQNPMQNHSSDEKIYSLLILVKKNIQKWAYAQNNTNLTNYIKKIYLEEENDINLEKEIISGKLISINKLAATSKNEYRDNDCIDKIKIKQLISVIVKYLKCICVMLEKKSNFAIQNREPMDITHMERFLLLFKKHVNINSIILKQNNTIIPKKTSLQKLIRAEECNGSWKQTSNTCLRGGQPKSLTCKSKRIAFSTIIH